MINKFNCGTIVRLQAGEDLKNNDLYILDPDTRKIRKPKDCDEWLICQLVYVYDYDVERRTYDFVIHKDNWCRCWIGFLII